MKNKLAKNKKFNLEKIEVAKLNYSQMLGIVGGLLPTTVVTTTGHNDSQTSRYCDEDINKPK